jgi:hypothetical protein
MEIRSLFPSALVATALVLSGCGGSTEVSPGVDVEISDETLTITGGEGDEEYSVTTGGAAEIPANFPSDFPLPEDATLTSAVSESQEMTGLIMEWPGMTADSLKDYLNTVQAAGYMQDGDMYEMDMGGGDFSAGGQFTGSTHTIGIVGTSSDGVGQLSITALVNE